MHFSHSAAAEDSDEGDSAKPKKHSGEAAAAHDGDVAIHAKSEPVLGSPIAPVFAKHTQHREPA